MCSHVGRPIFLSLYFAEGETEAQGGDRICKLVPELGCKHGNLGFWLFVLPMTQAAFVTMKRAGRHILVPGEVKAQTFQLCQVQKWSGERWRIGGFEVRKRQEGRVQHLNTALLCNRGQFIQPALILGFPKIGCDNDAFFTVRCEDQMGFSCDRLSTAPGKW